MGSKSTTLTIQKDLRTDLSQAVAGQIAGPGAVTTQPGSVGVATGDYGRVSLNLTGAKLRAGMSGAEVLSMLQQQGTLASQQLAKVADFAQASMSAATAARTGEATDWTRYVPYAVVLAVVYLVVRRNR
jgi:hypothetical protein